jgi:hypothetical protein
MLKIQNVGVFQWSYGIALTISDRGRYIVFGGGL